MRSSGAPWLDLALAELGTKEDAGPGSDPVVLAYFDDVGRADIVDDATAWCAAATGSWLARSGQPIPPPHLALLARSYQSYGVPCDPRTGAIGVWPRGSADWQGHVGIVLDVDLARGVVRRISGNLADAVRIDKAPIATALAFRWPVSATVQALRKAGSTEIAAADMLEVTGVGGVAVAAGGAAAAELLKAPGAPGAPPAPVLDPGDLQLIDQLAAAAKAVGALLVERPWLGGCVLAALALLVIGRRIKRRRVARAAAGAPLSSEVLQ
jgi:uncharacterized protein (TIGR02594 family)